MKINSSSSKPLLQNSRKYLNLILNSFNSHLNLIDAGSNKDMLIHVNANIVHYLENLNTKLKMLEPNFEESYNLIDSFIVLEDKLHLNSYNQEYEIVLSALYNLNSIIKNIENLLNTSNPTEDSYLDVYNILECLHSDYKYLKLGIFQNTGVL